MSGSAPFLEILNRQRTEKTPFWFMRQAGRYLPEYRNVRSIAGGFLDLCYNPELATEVTLQPLRRFDMDAAILFSDILVVPQALGFKLEFLANHGPKLEVVDDQARLEQISMTGFLGKLQPVFETIENLRKNLPEGKALIGFSGSPWTLACYMCDGNSEHDFAITKKRSIEEPEFFAQLTDILVEAISLYLIEQVRNGVQTVQLFDSWAGLLDDGGFERWVIEPTARIVENIRKQYPHVPIIGFPRQAGVKVVEYVNRTGVTAIGLDTGFSMSWAAENIPSKCVIQGNLDPLVLRAGGDVLRDAVNRIFDGMGKRPFIFNLGHGIVPDTPIEHVENLCAMIRDHS